MMKSYSIHKGRDGDHETMIIRNRTTGLEIAEYRADNYNAEVRRMRRVIDAHLAASGTLGNYQW